MKIVIGEQRAAGVWLILDQLALFDPGAERALLCIRSVPLCVNIYIFKFSCLHFECILSCDISKFLY